MPHLSREPPAGPSSPLRLSREDCCAQPSRALWPHAGTLSVKGTMAVRGVAPLLTCAMGQARVQEPGALP